MTSYLSPIQNPTITSWFALRNTGVKYHPGIDLQTSGAPHVPQPLSASADGTIIGAFLYKDGTINILIAGDDGRTVLYSGLSLVDKETGQILTSGLQIGDRVTQITVTVHSITASDRHHAAFQRRGDGVS